MKVMVYVLCFTQRGSNLKCHKLRDHRKKSQDSSWWVYVCVRESGGGVCAMFRKRRKEPKQSHKPCDHRIREKKVLYHSTSKQYVWRPSIGRWPFVTPLLICICRQPFYSLCWFAPFPPSQTVFAADHYMNVRSGGRITTLQHILQVSVTEREWNSQVGMRCWAARNMFPLLFHPKCRTPTIPYY
jgi:hypothetical protein